MVPLDHLQRALLAWWMCFAMVLVRRPQCTTHANPFLFIQIKKKSHGLS